LVEYTADGRLLIMPPTDPDSDARNAEIIFQLKLWARTASPGLVNGGQAGFRLPNGARRSPDAASSNLARWRRAKQRVELYPVFTPEFMVELRSPDDRMRDLRDKVQEYIDNGCQLGWLIDPIARRVEIYRPGQCAEVLESPNEVRGDGPVEGFLLDLKPVYA
jgi:Uma2 family endonuclease